MLSREKSVLLLALITLRNDVSLEYHVYLLPAAVAQICIFCNVTGSEWLNYAFLKQKQPGTKSVDFCCYNVIML